MSLNLEDKKKKPTTCEIHESTKLYSLKAAMASAIVTTMEIQDTHSAFLR